MDTNCYKILKYSLNQDDISGLCNFDYEENCLSCSDINKSYLELYKQMVIKKVSTRTNYFIEKKKKCYNILVFILIIFCRRKLEHV